MSKFREICTRLKGVEKPGENSMILVVTRGKNSTIYNGLKHEGDVVSKISTQVPTAFHKRTTSKLNHSKFVNLELQVVQSKNIGNSRYPAKTATVHNILLKINSKLGGTNQALHRDNRPNILGQPVMIMGADVTHPASDHKDKKPSIAAVVGSVDARASQYKCEVRFQVGTIF